jgi:DNA ligase 1
VLYAAIAQTSHQLAATASRKAKIERLAALLVQLAPDEHAIAARHLAGDAGYKLGVGHAAVAELRGPIPPAGAASLTIVDIDRRLAELAGLAGAGSARAKRDAFAAMLAAATGPEQAFLGALVVGELRQGALDALVVDAIACAARLEPRAVRAAHMLAGDLGAVAAAALADGAAGLARFGLRVFRPILPMLAQTADTAGAAIASFAGPAALELKLDGFRVQIHKDGDAIRVYSRALNDVTAQVPEVARATAMLPARQLILDGEASAFGPGGRPLPFQDTMRRRGALTLTLFDALLVDDQTLLATAAGERFAALAQLAPGHAVPRLVTADAAEADAYFAAAIERGHEGVMAKALDAPYDAGNRGAAWLKIKKVYHLDLVVLAVEWGSGRRRGLLSNLHLGARDPAGGWVMLGKTFKGMTDEMLAWQTAQLLAREVDRDGHVVYVRPELVAEIAFNDVQRSSRYPGGFALRLARVVRYRVDKAASEADTIDAVRAIAIRDGVVPA